MNDNKMLNEIVKKVQEDGEAKIKQKEEETERMRKELK